MAWKINKRRKRILFSLLVVVFLSTGFITWNTLNYKKIIKKNLSGWVSKATNGKYHASVTDINISLFTRQITITGIKVWPDTNIINHFKETGRTHNISVTLAIPKLQLSRIEWFKLLSDKELACGNVRIWQPDVLIISKQRIPDSLQIRPDKKKSPAINKILAHTVDIMQPDIVFRSFNLENDSFDCKLIGGNAVFNKWFLCEDKNDTSRFLFAKSCSIDSSGFSFCNPATLYEFRTPYFHFNSDQMQLNINDLVIAPIVNRETYYVIKGHRATILNLKIARINATGFDGRKLIHSAGFCASDVTITDPAMGLFYNYLIKSRPENMMGLDPHQLLHKSKVKLNIKNISVNNGSLVYTELNRMFLLIQRTQSI